MNEKTDDLSKPSDPRSELTDALKLIDHSIQASESKETCWQQFLNLLRCFLSEDYRTGYIESRRRERQRLFNAIDWIKKNYALIEKYQQSEESALKSLGERALQTIDRYNIALEKEEAPPVLVCDRIIRFISEQAGLIDEELAQNKIEIPKTVVHAREETVTQPTSRLALKAGRNVTVTPAAPAASRKVATIARPLQKPAVPEEQPSIHEINAFQVKVYSLINEHGISLDSIREALHTIKEAPIEAKVAKVEPGERAPASIVSLKQILSFLPGEVIELTGAFQRVDPQSAHSIPLLETFRLYSTSTQTGHPDPRQHTGWALPNALIPSFPLRPHQLPLLQPLYRRKNEAAVALLPKGGLNTRARQLYALKRKIFEQESDILIKKHFRLCQAITSASLSTPLSEAADLVLPRFFQALGQHPQPIEFLAETYQKLNDAIITAPNEKLKAAYLDRSNVNLQVEDPEIKLQEAEKIISAEIAQGLQNLQNMKSGKIEPVDVAAIDFMCAMGALLAEPVRAILLQQYSEIIGFKPPMLNDFEQKIQACSHKQLKDFLDELEGDDNLTGPDILPLLERRIFKHLDEEIALFEAKSFDHVNPHLADYVHELEAYYHARYYARNIRK